MRELSHAELTSESRSPVQPDSQKPGKSALHVVASQDRRAAIPEERNLDHNHGPVSFLRALGRKLAYSFTQICFEEQWRIAVRPRVSGLEAFNLKACQVLLPPRDRFYADPFVFERAGHSYLFFEEFPFATRKGVISCIEFGEQGFIGSPSVVLETTHHLSYPFLFEWDGQLYMLPESHDSGRIELFRAVDFPLSWEFATCLLENVWAVDATICKHEDKFWMFAGGVKKNGRVNSELFLYYADSPLGPWLPHARNPVVADASRARPAGQVFTHDGVLIRPGQDCSQIYGGAIVLNRIDVLSPTEYAETPIRTLGPEWFPSSNGTHTLNHSEHYQATDARIIFFQPKMIPIRLWRSLCEHLHRRHEHE